MNIVTNDTMGFTIVVEHKSGGKIGTWELTIEDALKVIKRHWDKDHTYARIFPTKYKDRMRLK